MSGGGTIYTDMGGWQFTFIQHKEAGEIEFSQYIAPVIDALREMGVNAAFNGRNDLTIDGMKFSGNAQLIEKDRVLHHGTLLFSAQMADLSGALKANPLKFEDKAVKSVQKRVTNISSHLPEPMDVETFIARVMDHVSGGAPPEMGVFGRDRRNRRHVPVQPATLLVGPRHPIYGDLGDSRADPGARGVA